MSVACFLGLWLKKLWRGQAPTIYPVNQALKYHGHWPPTSSGLRVSAISDPTKFVPSLTCHGLEQGILLNVLPSSEDGLVPKIPLVSCKDKTD